MATAGLATVTRKALASVKDPNPADVAAGALAVAYAKQIDADPDQLSRLGPLLLVTLDALLLTPKARSALQKGVKDAAKRANPLDELRDRRAARERNAAVVDSPAP